MKQNWELSAEAFDGLLAWLDADRERAGEKYETIRRKLHQFFTWRGCSSAEEQTDRTIDRVARRLGQLRELQVDNPYVYFHGVALNVLREYWREPGGQAAAIEGQEHLAVLSIDPEVERERRAERARQEQRLACLETCVARLPVENRKLLVEYHGAGFRIAARKALAQGLGIPLNALRIRAYRIRVALEACVDGCVKQN